MRIIFVNMYKYLLPNGIKVDAERLADVATDEGEYPQVYLDTQTGALVEISTLESLGKWVEEIGTTNRYVLFERFTNQELNEVASDFIDTILADMASEWVDGARDALERGGWSSMEEFLEEKTDGWIHAWDQFMGDEAWEYVREWLTENPRVSIREEFEGCGHCAVCELVRRGEDGDESKLMDAFMTEEVMQHVSRQFDKQQDGRGAVLGNPVKEGSSVMTFKVTLNESSPRVWRRIVVLSSYTFFDLHCAIQNAMGWSDGHLHAFRVDTRSQSKEKRKGTRTEYISIEYPNPEADDFDRDTRDERVERIADWFGKRMQQCVYEYDFGDGWDHTVLFEGESMREEGVSYPQCIAGKNACPPEDCGGVGGYDNLQKILKNPKHPEYNDTREWLLLEEGEKFDPKQFDMTEVEFEDPAERLEDYESHFA